MSTLRHVWTYLLMCGLVAILRPFHCLAQQNPDTSNTSIQPAPTERDGQHDFDFWRGTWKIHNRRLVHPLTGSTTWVEFEGTSIARGL
jgi:hypothetical protein